MREKLINILKEWGYPVKRQGSFAATAKYPDHFFTVWNSETADASNYSNRPVALVWIFQVNFYSTSASKAESVIQEVAARLRQEGWIIDGLGQDAASDEPTHVGKSLQAVFRQNIEA